MLVELEAVSETGLGVLLNQVILFLLRGQGTPGQLWKCTVEGWTGRGTGLVPDVPQCRCKGPETMSSSSERYPERWSCCA
jgi:hypothetical protein